ncbi:MAG: TldD/PmbA family protein [Gemmatimonadetes bacterium]|nr:TldD/PmbA family protein [Gemmatimonadota bacterium]MCC6771429.1 TldD/PmbA family protein [Gemmatimonadaceae bacterium]
MTAPRSLYVQSAPIISRDDAQALAKRILYFATADSTRVTIRSGARANSRFAVNQISTAGDNSDTVITVLSSFGKRSATATTNKLDDAGLQQVVANSEKLARLSPEDPEAMPELGPQQYAESIGWSDATATLDPVLRAAAIKTITEPARTAGLVSTGYIEARGTALAIANSKGLFAYSRTTESVLTTTVRTPDGQGSGWGGSAHWDWSRIDAASLGATAIQKAKASKEAVAIEPGRYTVVLEPTAVGNLVQLIAGALNARNADEGRSFFTKPGGGNKVGMKVVDERVTLVTDPLDPDIGSNTFGADGLPISRTVWLENGVVKNLAYDRFWADKQGKVANTSGGGGGGGGGGFGGGAGLKMNGGDGTLDDLIAGTERGILVTRFWYIRPVDPRTILYTGLTRDGTFLIEKGKITKAVKNFRFNESPIFMLNNLEAMSRPIRVSASESGNTGQAIVVPAIRTREFSFTSLSDAV